MRRMKSVGSIRGKEENGTSCIRFGQKKVAGWMG